MKEINNQYLISSLDWVIMYKNQTFGSFQQIMPQKPVFTKHIILEIWMDQHQVFEKGYQFYSIHPQARTKQAQNVKPFI